jgi:hypothetical protein
VTESEKVECAEKARAREFNDDGDNTYALGSRMSSVITDASFDVNCGVCDAAVTVVFWQREE